MVLGDLLRDQRAHAAFALTLLLAAACSTSDSDGTVAADPDGAPSNGGASNEGGTGTGGCDGTCGPALRSGSVVTVANPVLAPSNGNVQLLDHGFEFIPYTCGTVQGSQICVSGGITP